MSFLERLDDIGIEPDLEILTMIVGREEAEKRLEEWRLRSLDRRLNHT